MKRRQSDIQIFVSDGISPYPDYKDSGIAWLGQIPSHWDVNAVRRDFDIQLGKMLQPTPNGPFDSENPYFKAQHVKWEAVQTTGLPFMWARPVDEVKYGVRNGDLLVCEGGEVGRAGVVFNPPDRAIIQNALHRVRSLGTSDIRLLMYLLQHIASQGWFDILCNRATIAHFTSEKFGDLPIPVPSLPEQQAIAAFLDRETARIDALVAKKEQLIELLQEKRAALISHVVTRGLDSKVPTKDSGVDWLGEVPAHWEIRRLKHLVTKIGSGKTPSGGAERYVSDGIMLLRSQNVHFRGLQLSDVAFIDATTDDEMAGTRVREGDVLLNITGASLGRCCEARLRYFRANVNQHVCIIRPDGVLSDSSFLARAVESQSLQDQIFNYENGVSRDALNFEQIGTLVLPAPMIKEQRTIAAFLDRETAKIDSLTTKVQEAIDRLNELRAALISAAVTGKIDVRTECADSVSLSAEGSHCAPKQSDKVTLNPDKHNA